MTISCCDGAPTQTDAARPARNDVGAEVSARIAKSKGSANARRSPSAAVFCTTIGDGTLGARTLVSLLDRFFGRNSSDLSGTEPLVANPSLEVALGLQVLFPEAIPLDDAALTRALKTFDKSMARARCEIDDELSRD